MSSAYLVDVFAIDDRIRHDVVSHEVLQVIVERRTMIRSTELRNHCIDVADNFAENDSGVHRVHDGEDDLLLRPNDLRLCDIRDAGSNLSTSRKVRTIAFPASDAILVDGHWTEVDIDSAIVEDEGSESSHCELSFELLPKQRNTQKQVTQGEWVRFQYPRIDRKISDWCANTPDLVNRPSKSSRNARPHIT